MRIINRTIKHTLVKINTRLRLYKTLARHVLSYVRGARTTRDKDTSRITASEMRSTKRTVGYTYWDHKRNGNTYNAGTPTTTYYTCYKYIPVSVKYKQRRDPHGIPKAIFRYYIVMGRNPWAILRRGGHKNSSVRKYQSIRPYIWMDGDDLLLHVLCIICFI